MAAADVVHERWGYSVGGTDTDNTAVPSTTDRSILKVKMISFSGNASTATAVITSGAAGRTTQTVTFKDLDAATGSINSGVNHIFFGDKGIEMENVYVKVSNADDTVNIFLV